MPPVPTSGIPLCIELDGTLIHSSMLMECLLDAVRNRPSVLLQLPLWALRGRNYFVRRLAGVARCEPDLLPYNRELVGELESAAAHGRKVVLVTSADASVAAPIASHLGFVDSVIAPRAVAKTFPDGDYEYRESALGFPKFGALIRLLRPYQWLKNSLVFLPFFLAHEFRDPHKWQLAILAFLAFSLVASSGYVLNDVLDRKQDRKHPKRSRRRPVASGEVSPGWALLLMVPLLAAAIAACSFLPPLCAVVLVGYFASASAYSWVLKDRLMADVIMLGLLYTSRLFMGAIATSNQVSTWLAAFSVCLFLSLALCKRISELMTWKVLELDHAPGRKYRSEDIPLLEMMAVSSGFLACLVSVFYIQSSDVLLLYRHPHLLWVIVIAMLYWIGRLIIYTHRGKCPDDPIFFLFQDRTSMLVMAIALAVVALAI